MPDTPQPANDDDPADPFDMREDDAGWTVYDIRSGEPARVNGVPQTGLDIERADDLVDLLNGLNRQKGESTSH